MVHPTLHEIDCLPERHQMLHPPTSFAGVQGCEQLRSLVVSGNLLSNLDDLPVLPYLRELDVSQNCLRDMRGLHVLPQLADLKVCSLQIVPVLTLNVE